MLEYIMAAVIMTGDKEGTLNTYYVNDCDRTYAFLSETYGDKLIDYTCSLSDSKVVVKGVPGSYRLKQTREGFDFLK